GFAASGSPGSRRSRVVRSGVGLQNCTPDSFAAEYQKTMKPLQQRCKPTDTGTAAKLGGSTMQSLKPGKYINKSSGNASTKYRRAGASSPQLYTEKQSAPKDGSFMEALFHDSKNVSARPPCHSGKIALQLFPIDEEFQKSLQQKNHNPYLELTVAPRKKISSVLQHLNTKWGNSQCARGELMLFPDGTRLDNINGSERWTRSDSCTAADVHVAVGSPSTFRLRYGWFPPNFGEQNSGVSLGLVHSAGNIIDNEPLDPVVREQKQMTALSEFPSNFAAPSTEANTVKTMKQDNQSKETPLSWIDCISNISFGALLAEAAPSQDSKQLLPQNNSSLQQIPLTADSFDAAIASLIARQQASSQPKVSTPSLWDAEETCHAFPSQNRISRRTPGTTPSSCGASTLSVLGTILESGTDGEKQCSTEDRREEPNPQASLLANDDNNVKPDIPVSESTGEPRLGASCFQSESTGEPEVGASCSRLLSGTDSLSVSDLLANSLDAFQKFSVF
ncbi:Os01g0182400, partial [Oryza sativa Japonica Group]